MKIFKSLLFILLVLNPFSIDLLSNDNYKIGYVITLKGDTLNGYLLLQSSYNASRKCVFKKSPESEKTIYTPNDISAYRFADDKYFVVKQLDSDTGQQFQKVFMEFFIQGIVNIFYYVDNFGEHYYIEKAPYGLRELSEPERKTDGHISPSIYKGKLKSLMADCPAVDEDIATARLDYTSLVGLARKYHNNVCNNDNCIIYQRPPSPASLKFGIIAGYTVNRYKFGKEFISNYGMGFQFGAAMKIQNAVFSNDKFEICTELLLERDSKYILKPLNITDIISYKGVNYYLNRFEATSTPFLTSVPELPVKLNIYFLNFPIIVDYKINIGSIVFHTGIGIANKILLNKNVGISALNFEKKYGRTISPFYTGLIGKIGIERKSINNQTVSANLVYEYFTDPAAVNSYLRISEIRYSFQLLYMF